MTMTLPEARKIVASIPSPDHHLELDAALSRYWTFVGMYASDELEPEEQTLADRADFPHLFLTTEDGKPIASDVNCADFMVAVTGMPWDWCRAWDEVKRSEPSGTVFDPDGSDRFPFTTKVEYLLGGVGRTTYQDGSLQFVDDDDGDSDALVYSPRLYPDQLEAFCEFNLSHYADFNAQHGQQLDNAERVAMSPFWPVPPSNALVAECGELWTAGSRVAATIKYRGATGASLHEAHAKLGNTKAM